ncbi:MAG: sulfotransferase [Bacteroidota bacterium]
MNDDPFFIVGAQRSGTTYLYSVLDEHPSIRMARPLRPEPKFFLKDEEYALGVAHYLNTYFPERAAGEVLGEKSTSYIESAEVAQRIRHLFPEAKVLIILRDPVFRAVSNYFFSVGHGIETRTPREVFVEGVEPPEFSRHISVSPFNYLGRGEYLRYVRMYREVFEADRLQVLIFEQFVNRLPEVQSLYGFLGVDPNYVPQNLEDKINSSHKVYNLDEEVEDHLYRYYVPHIDALENELNLDLSIWK